MKRTVLFLCACALAAGLGFFAGSSMQRQEALEQQSYQCAAMLRNAVGKLEELRAAYDPDVMEALISNVYAAYCRADDAELSAALYTLWNALIFDGEALPGHEAALTEALQCGDPQAIETAAREIRSAP